MGYGIETTHLMDQDLWPTQARADWDVVWGTPAKKCSDTWERGPETPSAPPAQTPAAWVFRPDLQAPRACLPAVPHQRRLAVAVAREHGKSFKNELQALWAGDAPNIAELRRLLVLSRPWWHVSMLCHQVPGICLRLAPARLAVTPAGFFVVAEMPRGRAPGRLAPLCSTEFSELGAPEVFVQQVHSEINSVLRRRHEIWRELHLFSKPQKSLHTCRSAPARF